MPTIQYLLTDIDDTLTDDGKLGPQAYQALWDLQSRGVRVIPVTGRPAGWCEMIARFWPVEAVVGENGGFYFRYVKGQMKRSFAIAEKKRIQFRNKLDQVIAPKILKTVKGSAIASDQFSRLMDLAIDYCEDVAPLPKEKVNKIVDIFEEHGATAKISSIHVNGWFGQYDKLSTSLQLLKQEFKVSETKAKTLCAFSGDSPNDEPMFSYFPHSYAVANISRFLKQLKSPPRHVVQSPGGQGFSEIAKLVLGQI